MCSARLIYVHRRPSKWQKILAVMCLCYIFFCFCQQIYTFIFCTDTVSEIIQLCSRIVTPMNCIFINPSPLHIYFLTIETLVLVLVFFGMFSVSADIGLEMNDRISVKTADIMTRQKQQIAACNRTWWILDSQMQILSSVNNVSWSIFLVFAQGGFAFDACTWRRVNTRCVIILCFNSTEEEIQWSLQIRPWGVKRSVQNRLLTKKGFKSKYQVLAKTKSRIVFPYFRWLGGGLWFLETTA